MLVGQPAFRPRTGLVSRRVSGWCVARALVILAIGVIGWWATITLVVPHTLPY